MKNHLSGLGEFVIDFTPCGRSDISSGLRKILKSNSIVDSILMTKVKLTKRLFVDILGLVYSKIKKKGYLIVCEVKNHSLTLTDFAQLIGYCIASNVKYGLLISLDKRITGGFEAILKQSSSLVKVKRIKITHFFAICMWRTNLKELFFNEIGAFTSLLAICRDIASSLEKIA